MENKKTKKDFKTITVRALLDYVGPGFKKSDTSTHYTLKVTKDDMPKLKEALDVVYKDTDDTWVPKWYKEYDGTVYLHSQYDIPCKLPYDKRGDSAADCMYSGADVKCKLKLMDGVIYPMAFVVITNGEEGNPFEDM